MFTRAFKKASHVLMGVMGVIAVIMVPFHTLSEKIYFQCNSRDRGDKNEQSLSCAKIHTLKEDYGS